MGGEALLGKAWLLAAYPCAQKGAMHQWPWDGMGLAGRIATDDLEFHMRTVRRDGISGTKGRAAP